MKLGAAVLLSATLAGCASGAEEVRTGKPADSCTIVAEQRMHDGALNGYDRRLQKITYDYAYTDCVRWNKKYGVGF